MDVRAFLEELKRQPGYDGQVVYERFVPPRTARYAELNPPLPPVLQESLRAQGIARLYSHQVEAVAAARGGTHVVVVTPTASGKTLCYNLPVLETLADDQDARALYLFPTKALAQDQADGLAEFGLPDLTWGTYDGDTPTAQRRSVREKAQIILTNPDMLHLGILPQHYRWANFFRHLHYVVIDDVHTYRGVFGSNVANILRRLRRVCRLHGSDPVFICTSATIANPAEFASTLVGLPVTVIDADGSPGGPRWFVFWNPPLIALEDALDQYLMRNPEYLLARPSEHAVIDPENPYILAAHLRCAAAELPLWEPDVELFGPRALEIAQILEERGELGRRRDRWYWTKPGYPAQDVEVRAASGDLFRIVDESRRRLVGTVDAVRAFEQVHPGAVYLHQGETYVVQQLDLTRRIAAVTPGDADYYTQPRSTTDLDILASLKQRSWGSTTASFGDVEVTTQVIAFARKRLFSEEVLDEEPLDLPEQRLQTAALWFVIPEDLEAEVRRQRLDLAGGIHAVEHAAIGVLPLFAMCDRWDLGGVSYLIYPKLGAPAIFIYESHPGGVGIAEKVYELLDDLMAATLHTIDACPCEYACSA